MLQRFPQLATNEHQFSQPPPMPTTAATAEKEAEGYNSGPSLRPLRTLSPSEVSKLLVARGFVRYANRLAELHVSGADLAEGDLCEEDLKEMGVDLGLHRRRLLRMFSAIADSQGVDIASLTGDEWACAICMEEPKTCALIPCGHKCICAQCAETFSSVIQS